MLKLFLWLVAGAGLLLSAASLGAWILLPAQRNIERTGGVELVLAFDAGSLPPGADRTALAKETIEVLRQRVDPQGTKGIVWRVKDGGNIVMQAPYPSAAARQARAECARAQADLESACWQSKELSELAQQAAQAHTPEDRAALLQAFVEHHLGSAATRPAATTRASQDAALNRAREAVLRSLSALAAAEKSFLEVDTRLAGVRPTDWTRSDVAERDATRLALSDATQDARALSLDIHRFNALMAAAEAGNVKAQSELNTLAEDFPLQAQPIEALLKARRAELAATGGVDDVAELRRLTTIGGVVDFRIAVLPGEISTPDLQEARNSLLKFGSEQRVHVNGTTARWFAIQPSGRDNFSGGFVIDTWADEPYVLLYDDHDHTLTHADPSRRPWRVNGGKPGEDVSYGTIYLPFTLDPQGGIYMGELTSANVKHPLAILLDDRALTAPTIQSQISTAGQITFGRASAIHPAAEKLREAQDLKLLLDAGALPAALKPVPVSTREIPPTPTYHPFPWLLLWTFTPLPIAALALVLLVMMRPARKNTAAPGA